MTDRRLIEAGFPCHQVGGETRRERDSGLAPPTHRLHVWWARRPLTPSRAAIEGSLLPDSADISDFVKLLGIEQKCAVVGGEHWILTGDLLSFVEKKNNQEFLVVDSKVKTRFEKEKKRRISDQKAIIQLKEKLGQEYINNESILKWEELSKNFSVSHLEDYDVLPVIRTMGNPAWFNNLMQLGKLAGVRVPNLYGYDRAYQNDYTNDPTGLTVLDPTSGGGSIPFEALRLGHNVIANELNPVAATILKATLDYPTKFKEDLLTELHEQGQSLTTHVSSYMQQFFSSGQSLPDEELSQLKTHLEDHSHLVKEYDREEVTTYLFCREVTCPSCEAKTPLLNSMWLSRPKPGEGIRWGVEVKRSDGVDYKFETYRVERIEKDAGKTYSYGPNGQSIVDDSKGTLSKTVSAGVGQCTKCKQAIDSDEIKKQARGESTFGRWSDRLYAVVSTRKQPKKLKDGSLDKYKSGKQKGQIKTEKIRYFRSPNTNDITILEKASTHLQSKWDYFDSKGLIPTEKFPNGNDMRPANYGMDRWYKLFTDRQLLGHLVAMDYLNDKKEELLTKYGREKGSALITYLQFMIDKVVDYNSKQTRWHFSRALVVGTFGRHDFSLKWTFGEVVQAGINSGLSWGVSQVIDAYKGLVELTTQNVDRDRQKLSIINGSGVHIAAIEDKSVDLVCMDPPYYDNVQYSELSDFYYVWQKRSLKDIHSEFNWPRLTNKKEEAVANIARDGSAQAAKGEYETLMLEIFAESRRVVKDDGVMTLMFTHKAQDAWETLTRSLIEAGWEITSCFPVESESGHSTHQMNMASAASTIFITCRKRTLNDHQVAFWSGLGGSGVQHQIRSAVEAGLDEFRPLKLNAVDQMIACYGRALQVLSENWPVMDGDEEVSPIRAMNEASRVVAEHQIKVITDGNISVDDLDTETAMALSMYGIWGHSEASFSEVLNLSRSLNISLETRTGGYGIEGRMVGINTEISGRTAVAGQAAEDKGYAAPLVKKGSKLRLAKPQERSARRVAKPKSDWDVLHGLLLKFREGDVPVARAYLDEQREGNDNIILDLLEVWGEEAETPEARNEARALLFGLRQ